MLNVCAKTLWRCQAFKKTYRVLTINNYASFTVKDVLYETSDEAGTLLTRFAKHVAQEHQKVCELVPSEVKYPNYFPISDIRYFQKELQKTSKEQIATVIMYASTYRSNSDPAKFAIILNELDRYALDNVNEMNADNILRTLYAFLFLIPNWMTRLDFYGRAMQRLYEEFKKGEDKSKEQFVQLCFYMGLSKKQTKFDVNKLLTSLLDKHLGHFLNEMGTLDMALVSNAAFKTSTVIKNQAFDERLLKEVLGISNISNGSDALLVTFIKSMRLQRLRSPTVCEYIKNICLVPEKLHCLQGRGQVHLFAYLAENLWDDKDCTQPLIETITEEIKSRNRNNCYSQTIRGKDISTFLWACVQLNCNISSVQLRAIEHSLTDKLNAREFNYFTDHLVDSCLSLWTLGYKTKELIQAAVQLKSESINKRQQHKVDSRLTVLLSAVQIEEPAWCATVLKGFEAFNLKAKVPAHLLNNKDIPYHDIITQLLKEEDVLSAQLVCPINGINIPGIHVKKSSPSESQVFVEFMTPSQTLHFSKEPVSILRLKLRLLQSLGHKVKVLSSTDILDPQKLRIAVSDCAPPEEQLKEPFKNSIEA